MNMKTNSVNHYLPKYKLSVVGGGSVGKSAITIQFIKSHFVSDYDPTIEDLYSKQCIIDNQVFKLDILDTAGQEEFFSMREQHLKSSDGFLLVFSVCDRNSFNEIYKLYKKILQVKDCDHFPMIIIANKCDLEDGRVISKLELNRLSQELKIPFLECSAKLKINIDIAFNDLIRLIRKFQKHDRTPAINYKSRNKPKFKNKCCFP